MSRVRVSVYIDPNIEDEFMTELGNLDTHPADIIQPLIRSWLEAGSPLLFRVVPTVKATRNGSRTTEHATDYRAG